MQADSIRTSIDLPRDLHRRLHELAARRGCSARQLILQSIEGALASSDRQRPRKRLNLNTPIVPLTGKPIALSDDQVYGGIEFP
jgi:predicted DNA-binding ribbon-helix-helix protein